MKKQVLLMQVPTLFGLEGVAADELKYAGFQDVQAGNGSVTFTGDLAAFGAQTIRFRKRAAADMTPFAEGMVISDEPGVYKDGKYGIRIETILLTVHNQTTADGKFLSFEPLTFVPLDRDLINPDLLTQETRAALNAYHARTLEVLLPYMTEEEGSWLKEQCREI